MIKVERISTTLLKPGQGLDIPRERRVLSRYFGAVMQSWGRVGCVCRSGFWVGYVRFVRRQGKLEDEPPLGREVGGWQGWEGVSIGKS